WFAGAAEVSMVHGDGSESELLRGQPRSFRHRQWRGPAERARVSPRHPGLRGNADGVPRRDRAWEGRRDGRRRRPPGSRDRARRVSFPRRARPRRRAMLSEEALVFVAAIIACGVLVLGVLELLAPTRRSEERRVGKGGGCRGRRVRCVEEWE